MEKQRCCKLSAWKTILQQERPVSFERQRPKKSQNLVKKKTWYKNYSKELKDKGNIEEIDCPINNCQCIWREWKLLSCDLFLRLSSCKCILLYIRLLFQKVPSGSIGKSNFDNWTKSKVPSGSTNLQKKIKRITVSFVVSAKIHSTLVQSVPSLIRKTLMSSSNWRTISYTSEITATRKNKFSWPTSKPNTKWSARSTTEKVLRRNEWSIENFSATNANTDQKS